MECIKLPISIFCEDFWYLSAIDNYRYPGCTTRTSVPSQPTALQKPSYKKEPYLQNKKPPHHRPTQPNPTQHHHPSYKNNRPTKMSLRKLVKSNRIKNKESKIKK